MGRGRARGKKLSETNQDDLGSGEGEKIHVQKRRGRPLKSLKDEIDEIEVKKLEDEDSEDTTGIPDKTKNLTPKKRKKNAQMEKSEVVKEENGTGTRSSTKESNKSNNFRNINSRRKSKPHRAAEAIVECN